VWKIMGDNMSVPARSTITLDVVNGDLTLGQDTTVKGTGNPQTIKVNGTIYCEGLDTFECNVTSEGFEAEEKVTIHGNLHYSGRSACCL
jgi:hypothetical protein